MEKLINGPLGYYTIWYSHEDIPSWIEFEAWEVETMTDINRVMIPVYGMDKLENPKQSPRFLKGSIKWDGCSNWTFQPDDHETTMVHFCGCPSTKLAKLFTDMYTIARDLMGNDVDM